MYPFEPQFSFQGAFHGKSALSVCSNGAWEATEKADFFIGKGQLVVQGTKRWNFERDDDNKNDLISMNRMDNSGGGDGGGYRDGGRGKGRGAPCAIPSLMRTEERGDWDHWQVWAEIPSAGRWGGGSPRRRRRKTPYYGWASLHRIFENRTQTPYATTPRGGPLGKFGSPGMMSADDGPAGRGTNSPIGGNPWQNFGLLGRMDTD